ncbi:MAG: flagellar hook-basal body complex protein [Rhodospirillaceae bacterium]|jgi:flagellar hook protein FlgE|nr:flagellar hook-basal body complex protein [Rhodospirillaceae bacterium]MBT5245574.1 flagellar hook-basal body complex protein [Rhodospirillaceae bacterium]MBT5561056.1 flagellar hook-basal body complex protein [Rhodospirillaceae bacterium]MBT6240692.1 flagellar hook-basal body complex protein [Rhodospirillaceae bacterium]
MSLFGALSSGVSGLTSQSSAMGAISDNITNVSTVGYKNTTVNFQSLVTKQTSSTFYSAGGVQSRPRQDTGVQGLLQASTSSTDLAISGSGFFVVNEAAEPTVDDQFLYTRSGSFFMDNEGFLRNTSGFYLQGWPTTAGGVVKPANTNLTIANQNIVSTDYLSTVNLNRVGGTASSTSTIGIGANLPSNDTAGTEHKTDVQFFDSLGNANTMSVVYTRSDRENQWSMNIDTPAGSSVMTLEDGTATNPKVYSSVGQLEFNKLDSSGAGRVPADGSTVIISGVTYEFDSNASGPANAVTFATTDSLSTVVAALVTAVKATDNEFADYGDSTPVTVNNRISVSTGSTTTILFKDEGTEAITVDPTGLLDGTGERVTTQDTAFTIKKQDLAYTDTAQFKFTAVPATTTSMIINSLTYTFTAGEAVDTTGADRIIYRDGTIAQTLADLQDAIEANDPSFSLSGSGVDLRKSAGATDNVLSLRTLSTGTYDVNFANISGTPLTTITEADDTAFAASTQAVNTAAALEFSSDGLPKAINVSKLEVLNFANGAADMDDSSAGVKKITMDFGTLTEANGMTQFGASFTPVFINQNGSRFGTFAGVTVSADGLVTALFDNGETRPIFKLPMATFVNVNGLESRTGNTWNATEQSGDYTLRVADNGPAGQTVQGTLEASTVDIGEEFTDMIVVQRAYSASAKIISTADQMLEELMRVKR